MTFDLGDIDNITQVKVYVNITMISQVEKCNQPSPFCCSKNVALRVNG